MPACCGGPALMCLKVNWKGSKIACRSPNAIHFETATSWSDEDPNQLPADRLKELRRQLNAVRTELERRSVDNDALEMRLARTEIKLLDAQQQLFLQLNSRTFKFVTRLKLWLRRAGLKPGPLVDWVSSLRRRRLF